MVSNISSRCLHIWAQIWDCKYNFRSASRCFESVWNTTSRVAFIFEHKHRIVNTNFDLLWNCLKYSFSCSLHSEQEHKIEHVYQILRRIYFTPDLSNFSVTNNLTGKYNCLGIGLKTRRNVWILIRRLLFLRKPVKEAFSVSRATVVSHAFTLSNCLDYLTLLLQHLVHLINSVFETNNRTVLE